MLAANAKLPGADFADACCKVSLSLDASPNPPKLIFYGFPLRSTPEFEL
jgi:hypothetical protein